MKALRWLLKALGVVSDVGEVVELGRKVAHAIDDTDPIPLSPRQITRHPTLRPPPRAPKK